MGLYLSVFIGFIYIKPKSLSVYLHKRFHTYNRWPIRCHALAHDALILVRLLLQSAFRTLATC